MEAFIEFGTSQEFHDEVDAFLRANCAGFDAYAEDGEQRLEWHAAFQQYVRLIEGLCAEWCASRGLQESALIAEMGAFVKSQEGNAAFLPEFLINLEYPHFMREMKERALADAVQAQAASAAASSSPVKAVGLWATSIEKNDPAAVEEFFAFMRVPWVFRKVLRAYSLSPGQVGGRCRDAVPGEGPGQGMVRRRSGFHRRVWPAKSASRLVHPHHHHEARDHRRIGNRVSGPRGRGRGAGLLAVDGPPGCVI